MYYYGNGYPGAPVGGYYPGAPVYQQNNTASLWAIVLVIFILFVIIGCGNVFRGCGGYGFGC
jgi:hypothetical protein